MDSGVSLVKALATTLLYEINSLESDEITIESDLDLAERVRAFEIKLIKAALIKTRGNQSRAASLLGIKNTTLHNKIKSYGIRYTKSPDGALVDQGVSHLAPILEAALSQ